MIGEDVDDTLKPGDDVLRNAPAWLADLIRESSRHFDTASVVTQTVFGFEPLEGGGWKVIVGQPPVELENGPLDGQVRASAFRVNIERIRECFDWKWGGQVPTLSVVLEHSLGGSWLTFDGTVKGQRVVLVIPDYPSQNARPEEIFDTVTGKTRRKNPEA